MIGKTYACVEGTLFHPAKRDCLTNEEVWQDGFCPLLTAAGDTEQGEDEVEDDEAGDDEYDDYVEADDEGDVGKVDITKEGNGTQAESTHKPQEEEAVSSHIHTKNTLFF